MAQRISRKSLKKDEFIDAAMDAEQWIEENWKQLAIGVGVVIVAVVLVLAWNGWRSSRLDNAQALLGEGLLRYEPPVPPQGLPAPDRDLPAALASFEKAEKAAPGSSVSQLAAFYRAATLLRLDRAPEAVSVLEGVVAEAKESRVGDTARAMLARAYAAVDDPERAAAIWQELSGATEGFYPPDAAMLELGRLRMDQGQKAEGERVLRELMARFPQRATAREAQALLQGSSSGVSTTTN